MGITASFSAADVILDLGVGSKRSLFQMLSAEAASRLGRPEQELLGALQAREQLGSTALGRGVALPHARLGGDGPPVTIFARLLRPIEFEARDDEPVDLVFLVLWHEASSEGFLPGFVGNLSSAPRTADATAGCGSQSLPSMWWCSCTRVRLLPPAQCTAPGAE